MSDGDPSSFQTTREPVESDDGGGKYVTTGANTPNEPYFIDDYKISPL